MLPMPKIIYPTNGKITGKPLCKLKTELNFISLNSLNLMNFNENVQAASKRAAIIKNIQANFLFIAIIHFLPIPVIEACLFLYENDAPHLQAFFSKTL